MSRREAAEQFFEKLDRAAVVAAIRKAEEKGLGEIRVHLQRGRVADPLKEAGRVFQRLGMDRTRLRCGCLLFIAPEERAFAVVGDTGIAERVGERFWLDARDAAVAEFAAGRYTEGVVAAVGLLGEALARHFPRGAADNPNELPDDVSEG